MIIINYLKSIYQIVFVLNEAITGMVSRMFIQHVLVSKGRGEAKRSNARLLSELGRILLET